MRAKRPITTLAALTVFWAAAAQTGVARFRIADRTSREGVVGAVVRIERDTSHPTQPLLAATGPGGAFATPRLPYGRYRLLVTSLGYDSLAHGFRIASPATGPDTLLLAPRAEAIDRVVVAARALRSSVQGDTLSYRAAAYKVAFGSDAASLLEKMPGMEVTEGGVEAQGRTVQRIYVDGREFFGNDVLSAIRNIPSDMIESIDIYQAQSDESEFTGVDNGEGHTSLNIRTLPDKRRGAFGRLYAAWGVADKYIGGGNVNLFNEERRITVVGLANNVSRQNFSFEDILGTAESPGGKPRNDRFAVRPLPGISSVEAVGLNYSDDWGAKAKATASYFFNRTDNRNLSLSDKQTFTATERMVLTSDRNRTATRNLNHRFSSRIDYRIDNRHSLLLRTALSVQDNTLRGENFSRTDNRHADDDVRFVNRRRIFTRNDNAGYTLSGSLIYRYRLGSKRAQTLTFGFGGGARRNDQQSRPRHYTFRNEHENPTGDTTSYDSRSLSRSDRDQPGYDTYGSMNYSLSLSKRSRLSIEYRCSYAHTLLERSTYLFDDAAGAFPDQRDQRQSTAYDYAYLTHRAGSTYQFRLRKTRIAASLYYQHATFGSDYAFPYRQHTGAAFDNLTYNMVANIAVDRNNTLKFTANARTANPRATDLQSIVNTTNRQHVFAGNPSLDPVYTHRISGQYIRAVPSKGRTFTLWAEISLSPNTITDSLVIDSPDFPIDDRGTPLGAGNQFTKPVNLGGLRILKATVSYGLPVRWLASNLNLRADFSSGRIPSIINGVRSNLRNDAFGGSLTLGSNLSENVDFRLAYTGRYNRSTSASRQRTLDNSFFSQQVRFDATVSLWRRIVLRAHAGYNSYRGITDPFREERLICNALAGVKLFRNRLAELSVGVNDILDRNRTTFRRTVTGTTLRNTTDSAVGRYVQVQFTYNLRHYLRQRNASIERPGNTESP